MMDDLISILSEIRSNYNCFDENEEPYYRALSEAIRLMSAHPEKHTEERTETHACDCISRRKAFEYFVTLWECIGTIMDRDEWEDVCMTTANEIPSAQPEIIRCKDCKYRDVFGYCVYGTRLAWVTESNDFCSKAERRGDEAD